MVQLLLHVHFTLFISSPVCSAGPPFVCACLDFLSLDLLLLFLILGHAKPSLACLDLFLYPVLFLVEH